LSSAFGQQTADRAGTKIKITNPDSLNNRSVSLPVPASQLFTNDSAFYLVIHQLNDKLLRDINTYDLEQHRYFLNKYYHTLAYIAIYKKDYNKPITYLDKGRLVFPNLGIANNLPERAVAISHL
jgi:hypothetical protein